MFVLVQLASIIKWNLNILNASKDRTEESVQNFTTHDMLISIFVLHQPGGDANCSQPSSWFTSCNKQ